MSDAWKTARERLKEVIFSDGGPDVSSIIKQNPILHLLPSQWWQKFPLISWCRGWRDDPAKQMQTVNAVLGWGLFTEEMRVKVIPEMMEHVPSARFLLKVVRRLEAARGEMVWWETMNPPLEDGSEAGYNEQAQPATEGAAEDVAPRRSARLEQASLGGTTQAGNPTSDKHKSTATPKRGKGRAMQAVVEIPVTSATSKLSKKPRRLSSRPMIKSASVIEDEDESEDEGGDEDGDEDGEQSGVMDLDRDGQQDTREDMDAEEMRELDTGEDSALGRGQDRGRQSSNEDTANETPLAERGTGNVPRLENRPANKNRARVNAHDLEPVSQLLRRINPGHVVFSEIFCPHFPHNILAFNLVSTDSEAGRKNRFGMVGCVENFERTLNEINLQRQILRDAVCRIGEDIVDPGNQYAAEYALTGMVNCVSNAKDVYVYRLSCILRSTAGREYGEDDGYADALHLAYTDGLYAAELLELDIKTGQLWARMKCTYAAGIQDKVPEEKQNLLLGNINKSLDGLRDLYRHMNRFCPILGYGRTEKESRINSLHGISLRANRLLTFDVEDKIIGRSAFRPRVAEIEDELATSEKLKLRIHSIATDTSNLLRDFPYEQLDSDPGAEIYVMAKYLDPLSTGEFCAIAVNMFRGHALGAIGDLMTKVQKLWVDAQNRDLKWSINDNRGESPSAESQARAERESGAQLASPSRRGGGAEWTAFRGPLGPGRCMGFRSNDRTLQWLASYIFTRGSAGCVGDKGDTYALGERVSDIRNRNLTIGRYLSA
ncbi:hypothetical protein CTheo_8656 [Ceratobasidium theobromae]|uniref:Uncharacterized protein n=1 Tax=Ceratobasidium theobromae TaxID=1582974 RepID=A0A5N5Q8S4_9AGAM|nr:hypothetical protein CTheo_8656 [Ceratobasidium theobromae]